MENFTCSRHRGMRPTVSNFNQKRSLVAFILALFFSYPAFAQDVITGRVTDAQSEGLPGVTVFVKETKTGTQTDATGSFKIKAVTGNTLVFSYIGFGTKEQVVSGTGLVNVTLTPSNRELTDVVVIGYGAVRKKDLTGSIAQIRPDKMADQNPNSVQDLLRGTPGLSVGMDPSAKGGGSIQIRGQRSVYSTGGRNNPLIVLDGMIFYGEFSEINPDDISQIDVLKDASAAAIYGARSANGVLIVTTKKGQQGDPKINLTTNLGLSTMGANRHVFDGDGYMQYRQDWYTAPTYGLNTATGNYEPYRSGQTNLGYYEKPTAENFAKYGITADQWRAYTASSNGSASDDEIWAKRLLLQSVALNNFLKGETFDWYNQSFRTGVNQDYNISASGASEKVNYYMSLGYLSNQGVIKGDDYKAIRANLKVEGKISKWLELGANINFQNRTDGNIATDWATQIIRNAPFASYKDSTGKLMVHPMGDNMVNNYGYNFDFNRQYMDLSKGYTIFNAILNAKVKLPFNITYSFNASPRFEHFRDRYFESAQHPDWKGTNGLVNREQTQRFNWSLNNTLFWEQTFARKHRVNVTLVQEAEMLQSWKDRVEARDIRPSDALGYHEVFYGDKQKSSYDADDVKETADGMLGRLFYSYDDRYMLTASVRRDGYSGLGMYNTRAVFFSTAFAWTFTSEKFINWKPLSNGKLRISWGQNGNRTLPDPYMTLANLGAGAGATMGYVDATGNLIQYRYLTVSRLANPNLRWEKTESLNLGIDFGFLDNRISGSFDYYHTPTVDMILPATLPGFSGMASITTNLGRVVNSGVELSLNTQNIRGKNFNWNTTIGFSKYKNVIEHLYYAYDNVLDADGNIIGRKEKSDIANRWFIDQPISAIWDYRVTGIWQADEAVEAAKFGQRPGDPKVANTYTKDDKVNTDGSTTAVYNDNDKQFLGQTAPPVMWSLRNDFSYKGFAFSFNLYSYMGHKSLEGSYLNQDNGTSLVTNLANAYDKNYWTLNNPTNAWARLDSKGPAGVNAPGRLYDRSFVRLENISLGYTLPKQLISRIGVDKLKFFAAVRNVAVWKKDKNWNFWDIETRNTVDNNNGMAPRMYTFGLNANF